jgi:glutaminyl-tRNA synthetase
MPTAARSRAAGSSRRSPKAVEGEPVQFERQGYFALDPDSKPGRLVFNRTVALRDSWARLQARSS